MVVSLTAKRMITLTILIVLGLLGYHLFFLSDAGLIKQRLSKLAQYASKHEDENKLQTMNKLRQSLAFFSPPITIRFKQPDNTPQIHIAESEQQLNQLLGALKLQYSWLKVAFKNNQIKVEKPQAFSDSILELVFENENGERVYDLYEIRLDWVIHEAKWFIKEVNIKRKETY